MAAKQFRSLGVGFYRMLAAIDLDDESGPMTGKIREVGADRHLPAKMPVVETFFKQAPDAAFGIGHVATQAA